MAGAAIALKLVHAPDAPDRETLRQLVVETIDILQNSNTENVMIPRGVEVLERLLRTASQSPAAGQPDVDEVWESWLSDVGLQAWNCGNVD